MSTLSGALRLSDNCLRIISRGSLHDEYQRGEFICPGQLSLVAGILDMLGGLRYMVAETEQEIAAACSMLMGEHYWLARLKPWDQSQPLVIVRDPVIWGQIPWVKSQCQLTILRWVRTRNDPDALNIPGLSTWMMRRDGVWIRRIGRKKYAKQYREFWNRNLPKDTPVDPLHEREFDRFGSKQAFESWVYNQ